MIIQELQALEILDSRGRPTIQVRCCLEGGASGQASVPSGASTGRAEARELRDGDPRRYGGLGCRKAVKEIHTTIYRALAGRTFETQAALDEFLVRLDGTPDKSRLGANALLAVSLSCARACAAEREEPLFRFLAKLSESPVTRLPRPTINLFSGGKHAGHQVAIQDVLIVPLSAGSIDQALADTYAVYQSAARLVLKKYAMRPLAADEGGLAPPVGEDEQLLRDAVEAVERAGLIPGRDMAVAVDLAATHFFRENRYHLGKRALSGAEMVGEIVDWVRKYPIVSVEDGLSEEDWPHWRLLRKSLPQEVLLLGDDLLCTNPDRIRKAVCEEAATALLLKVNQIGTLTEALEAARLARRAGWRLTVSARSGETEDDWLADLAVGWSSDYVKIGSITRSERLAKYNRLLAIEAATGLRIGPCGG